MTRSWSGNTGGLAKGALGSGNHHLWVWSGRGRTAEWEGLPPASACGLEGAEKDENHPVCFGHGSSPDYPELGLACPLRLLGRLNE